MIKKHSKKTLDNFWFYMNKADTEKLNNEYEELLFITFHNKPEKLTAAQHDKVFYELIEKYYVKSKIS
jgi:hypothetical protein